MCFILIDIGGIVRQYMQNVVQGLVHINMVEKGSKGSLPISRCRWLYLSDEQNSEVTT